MRFSAVLPLLLLLCCTFSRLNGQDLSAYLKKINVEQKKALLDYMRSQGGNLDQEIRQMYDQLQPEQREKSLQYLELLAKTGGQGARPPQTAVQWSSDTLSYHTLEEGMVVIDSFTVRNTGPNPYLIYSTQTSCDCTILRAPEFPVMPGESAVVRVEFNSANKIGKTRAGIVIYDNSAPNRRSILYLDGEIVPRRAKKPWE
jgi:hypothetical protein